MAKITYVSRDLNSLISGIIGAAPFLDPGLRRNDDGRGRNSAAISVRHLNALLRRHKPGENRIC